MTSVSGDNTPNVPMADFKKIAEQCLSPRLGKSLKKEKKGWGGFFLQSLKEIFKARGERSQFKSQGKPYNNKTFCKLINQRIQLINKTLKDSQDKDLKDFYADIVNMIAICALLKKSGAKKQALSMEKAIEKLNNEISVYNEFVELSSSVNKGDLKDFKEKSKKIHDKVRKLLKTEKDENIRTNLNDLRRNLTKLSNSVENRIKDATERARKALEAAARAESAAEQAQSAVGRAKRAVQEIEKAQAAEAAKEAAAAAQQAQASAVTATTAESAAKAALAKIESAQAAAAAQAANATVERAQAFADKAKTAESTAQAALAKIESAQAEAAARKAEAEAAAKQAKIDSINRELRGNPQIPNKYNNIFSGIDNWSQSWSQDYPYAVYILEKVAENKYQKHCIGYFKNEARALADTFANKMVELLNETRGNKFVKATDLNPRGNINMGLSSATEERSAFLDGSFYSLSRKAANQISFIEPFDEVTKWIVNKKLHNNPSIPENYKKIMSTVDGGYWSQNWSVDYSHAVYIFEKIDENKYQRHCLGYFKLTKDNTLTAISYAKNMVALLNETGKKEFTTGTELWPSVHICLPLSTASDSRSVLLDKQQNSLSRKPANQIPFIDPVDELLQLISIKAPTLNTEVKSTPEPQKTIQNYSDLQTPNLSKSVFELVNLGSAQVSSSDTHRDSMLTMSFTIFILEEMLAQNSISENEIENTKKLIAQYKSGLDIGNQYSTIDNYNSSKDEFMKDKTVTSNMILEKLEKDREIFIPSGYHAYPAGHAIGIRLKIVNIDGTPHVQGEVINRGEGLGYHGPSLLQGIKEQCASILTLTPVPLTALKQSHFLNCLTELNITGKNFRTDPSVGEFSNTTNYNIADFYEIALREWPGKIEQAGTLQEARGVQRGKTCLIKVCITPIKNTLSSATANHIKFKMRINSLKLLLDNVPLENCHVSHLEWAMGKINRSLKKLIELGIATDLEKEMCRDLSLRIKDKIIHIKEQTKAKKGDPSLNNLDLVNTTDMPIAIEPVPTLKGKPDPTIPTLNQDSQNAFSNILKAVDLIERTGKLGQYESFQIGNRGVENISQETVSRLSLEFLESLPPASDETWLTSPELTSEKIYSLHRICEILIITSNTRRGLAKAEDYDSMAYSSLSGRHIAALINTYAGILQRSQTHISPELLGQQAATFLQLIEDAGSQIRFKFLKDLEKFKKGIEILKALNSKPYPPKKLDLSGTFKKKFKSLEDIHNDPMANHIYQSLLKKGEIEKIKDPWGKIIKFKDHIEATIYLMGHMRVYYKGEMNPCISSLQDQYFDMTLLDMIRPLTMGLGGLFNFNQYPNVSYETQIGMVGYDGTPTLKIEVQYLRGRAGQGILCHSYFPWKEYDTKFVNLLLDRRSTIATGDNRAILSRDHENNQFFLSKEEEFRLNGEVIPSEEVEKLLSITAYDETLIPQCVRYFQQHFFRLKDPRFQALLEAFLLTRAAADGQPVLRNVMMDPNNTIAEQLIKFLEDGIQNARHAQLLDTELALTRILAQVAEFSKGAPFARYDKVKGLLTKSMQHLSILTSQQEMTIESTSKIRHWLVALYPYVQNNEPLVKICREASVQLCASGLNYFFDHRRSIQDDYDAGLLALSPKFETPPNRLPLFVTSGGNYLFSNINPLVRKINENTYEFEEEGIPTKIIVSGREFQTYQLLEGGDGKKRWFAYTASSFCPSLGIPKKCLEGTRFWTSVETPPQGIITSQKNNRVIYQIIGNKVINTQEPGLELAKIKDSKNPIFKNFFALDVNAIAWKTSDGRVKAFDFPTYDLRLELKDGKWHSSKHPGFYVDTQAVIMELEPHPHYLVLKNDKDKQLVIMPNLEIQSKETELIQTESVCITSNEHPSLLEFPIKKGKLEFPDDALRLLYLIHLGLSSLDYQMARKLIKKLSLHPAEWTEKEKEIYKWIELLADDDKHPHACALRCKLRLIAHKSEAREDDDLSKKIGALEEFHNDYFACLEQINSIGDWLTEDEEKEILKLLNEKEKEILQLLKDLELNLKFLECINQKKPFFNARQAELNQGAAQKKLVPKQIIDKGKLEIYFPKALNKDLQADMAHRILPSPIALKLRPGADFVLNFYAYYLIAYNKQPADKLEELKTLLRLSRNAPEISHRYLHTILSDLISETPKVKWPAPNVLRDALLRDNLKGTVKYALQISNITNFDELIPSIDIFKEKIVQHPDFEKNVTFSKGVRLKRATATIDRPAPFTAALKENNEIAGLSQYFVNQNPREQIQALEADVAKLQELLKDVFQLPSNNEDPCVINSYLRTRQGITEKISELQAKIAILRDQKSEVYNLNQGKVEGLGREMKQMIQCSQAKLDSSEEGILKILHSYPEDLQREVDGGRIRPLEFQELLVWFGCQNDEKILHSNPSLKEKLSQLKNMVAEYLVDLTEHNKLVRAEELLKDAQSIAASQGWDSVAARNVAENFIKTLTAKRAYDSNHPNLAALLAFEAFSGLRLRKDQIDALETLTTGTKLLDFEMEARTGFGKSQVLIPLWLFLTSRKDRLTMMTVPTALLSDQLIHLKKILGNAYSVGIQKIKFDRQQAGNVEYLRKINRQLEEAQKEKRVILIDIKSLHGLSGLALKESLIEKDDPNITKELLELRKSIQTKLSNFIDESRDCLDVRQRYDYSIGKPDAVTENQCRQIGNFFENFILSDAILGKWNFEFLPQHYDPKKLTLTAENIHLLQDDLAELILDSLEIKSVDLRKSLKTHLLGGAADQKVKDYLILSLPNDQLKQYAWLKDQLTSTLRRSFLRTCGENYDLLVKEEDEGQENVHTEGLTVPCLRGVPKPTSEFTNLDDRMISTTQANLKREFSQKRVQRFIQSLQELAIIREEDIVKDPLYQLFDKIQEQMAQKQKGEKKSLFEITNEDIIKMTNFLNEKDALQLRLEFIKIFILPKITFFKKKISGTSFNLIRSQHHVQAASGTVDPDTLPPRMKPIEKASAPIGNVLAMYKNSNIETINSNQPKEILSKLLDVDRGHRVIVDAAGHFRDLSQEEIIKIILKKTEGRNPPVHGITFYDDDGHCMILERGSSKAIPRENSDLSHEKTFIFIRQSKAVGSDTPMAPTAKAFVTFGKDTPESFFWQACGRMRGLETGQKLDIVLIEDDAKIIAKTFGLQKSEDVKISHIFKYAKKVESHQKGKDYFFSLRLYLEDLIENILWKHLEDPQRFDEVFNKLWPLLVDSTEKNPLNNLFMSQKPIPAKDAVKLLKESVLAPLKAIEGFADEVRAIEHAYDKHVDLNKLPHEIVMADSLSEEADMDIEEEATEETEQEHENESENETIGEKTKVAFNPSSPEKWSGDYTSIFNEQSHGGSLLGIPLHYSPNFFILEKGKDLSSKARKHDYQFIIKVDSQNKVSLAPLSPGDSQAALNYMSKTKKTKQELPDGYHIISGRSIIASAEVREKPVTELSGELQGENLIKVNIICKILSGDKSLGAKEIQWLKKHPRELEEQVIPFAKTLLATWPHLLPLTKQLERLKNEAMHEAA